MRPDFEQAELEDLEQTHGAGTDDDDVGLDGSGDRDLRSGLGGLISLVHHKRRSGRDARAGRAGKQTRDCTESGEPLRG